MKHFSLITWGMGNWKRAQEKLVNLPCLWLRTHWEIGEKMVNLPCFLLRTCKAERPNHPL